MSVSKLLTWGFQEHPIMGKLKKKQDGFLLRFPSFCWPKSLWIFQALGLFGWLEGGLQHRLPCVHHREDLLGKRWEFPGAAGKFGVLSFKQQSCRQYLVTSSHLCLGGKSKLMSKCGLRAKQYTMSIMTLYLICILYIYMDFQPFLQTYVIVYTYMLMHLYLYIIIHLHTT